MKKTAAIISAIMIVILLAGVAAGTSINGDYKGNPIVNVLINGVKLDKLDVPAMQYDGRTLLPLRACVESINGIVGWEEKTKTATVLKPETSIFFFTLTEDQSATEEVYSIIPVLEEGKSFYSAVDIGGIPQGTYTIKCELENQAGTVFMYVDDTKIEIKNSNDMVTVYAEWESFEILQEVYKFKVYMKDSAGAYKLIAVKTMNYK